jgi:hypothetical protein
MKLLLINHYLQLARVHQNKNSTMSLKDSKIKISHIKEQALGFSSLNICGGGLFGCI